LLVKLGRRECLLQLLEEGVPRGHDVNFDGDLETAVPEVFHLGMVGRDADAHPIHGPNHDRRQADCRQADCRQGAPPTSASTGDPKDELGAWSKALARQQRRGRRRQRRGARRLLGQTAVRRSQILAGLHLERGGARNNTGHLRLLAEVELQAVNPLPDDAQRHAL